MSVKRKVQRVGGSLGVLIPRDFAEAMSVKAGSEVRLTLVGRQVVVEPVDDTVDDATFRRAFAAVLRRNKSTFAGLAAFDRGERPQRKR
jgi:antitoxin component of MazEF toxin-antitoxin module